MSCSVILIGAVPFTAHRARSHRLSRSPAVRRAAWLRAESRCSERHWTAQCGGASLESYRFFSLSPSCVKVQLRPLWLPPPASLVPQPPQQVPTQTLWAAHPSVLPPSAKKKGCFPTIPWWHGQCFLHWQHHRGYVFGAPRILTHFCSGFLSSVNIWSRVKEVEAKINPKQQSIYRRRAHPWFDPPVALSFL